MLWLYICFRGPDSLTWITDVHPIHWSSGKILMISLRYVPNLLSSVFDHHPIFHYTHGVYAKAQWSRQCMKFNIVVGIHSNLAWNTGGLRHLILNGNQVIIVKDEKGYVKNVQQDLTICNYSICVVYFYYNAPKFVL